MTDNSFLLSRASAELNDLKTNVRYRNVALAEVNIRKINSFLAQLDVKILGPSGGDGAKAQKAGATK